MTNVRTLTVSLAPQQASRIEAAVAAGSYASNSEVVREALRLWEQREEIRASELGKLKHAYVEGIASGPGRAIDAQFLIKGFKEKAAKRG